MLILFFLLLLASCGTSNSGSNSYYRTPNTSQNTTPYITQSTTPITIPNENQALHQYAHVGKGIAQQIYSRTTYDYNYRNQMEGNKIGRAPQESPEPYPKKICTGYAIEFFVLFNTEMKNSGLYNDKRVKAMIYDEPNHWRNLIIDNIHKQAYIIEPQNGKIEILDYDSLPTKANDLYYHGPVTVIGRM